MSCRIVAIRIGLALVVAAAPLDIATGQGGPLPGRAIRRDIPLTNTIRRAFAAGTRDSTGNPGRNYWQQWTEYTITAKLDVPTSTIAGRETVVLHHNGDTELRTMVLRLDQNIFRATVARSEGLGSRVEVTGGMQVTRLAVNGQAVNLNPPRQRGGNPAAAGPVALGLDETVARILLPSPIAPKSTVTIEAEWTFKVPSVQEGRGIRMGRLADSLYQIAQWYPRIAVYDDLRGWDTEPYLGPAEFYHNFGRWDVSLDVPAGWIVGATGVLQNAEAVLSPTTRERLARVAGSDDQQTIVGAGDGGAGRATAPGDRLVWRFVADTAGDFAWATSRSYVWDATRATIPGRGIVPVHILYLPGDSSFRQVGAVARHALEFYSNLWIPYGFPQLTVTDGPELGMEYPMFIMSGLGAADHETGHQWWPMMVGVNETWYGWMDEGFNQYMNALSSADRRGVPPALDGPGQQYGRISGNELESPMMWPANYQGPFYGFTTYTKAPQMLSMLGGIVGDSAVQRAMSAYAAAWRFRHPSPWDYMFFMNRALGRDLGWFWYSWLFTTDAVHGSIANLTASGGRTTVTVRQDGEMPAPVVLQVQFAPNGPAIRPMPNSRMTDSVTAIVTWPVDVWFGGQRTFAAVLDFGGRAVTRVTLDPFRRFPDRDPSDNTWPR
jgi:hypothetical protein